MSLGVQIKNAVHFLKKGKKRNWFNYLLFWKKEGKKNNFVGKISAKCGFQW